MDDFVSHLNHYHWWIIGVALVILEILAPAFFFLWLGVSAGLVGLILLVYPELLWKGQLLTFTLLSVASIYLSRAYLKKNPTPTDRPTLNRRGSQYLGRTFTLTTPIIDGVGRLQVDDSSWKIIGLDRPAGEQVKVVKIEGTALIVEAADPPST
ncbi:MAG: NfeD family protein [Magnetococcales bacterium]|nr:NfeD family protein [Magnetococcales bacterium]